MKREAIRRLLPAVFQRAVEPDTPLAALLGAMRDLSAVLNPRSTPDRFLPYLSRWVNLDWLWFRRTLDYGGKRR